MRHMVVCAGSHMSAPTNGQCPKCGQHPDTYPVRGSAWRERRIVEHKRKRSRP